MPVSALLDRNSGILSLHLGLVSDRRLPSENLTERILEPPNSIFASAELFGEPPDS